MHFLAPLFALCALLACGQATADEVLQLHQGLTLNAALELAPGKTLAEGVVLLTHGGLGHRDMETMIALRQQLHTKGYSTLAITLSLGMDNRHGMFACALTHRHRNSDAAAEVHAWIEWLAQRGAQRITLLGHSRGGAQTALYAANQRSQRISAVVLLAPAVRENTDAVEYQRRTHKPLAPALRQARALVKRGKGDALLRHVGVLNCPDTNATAASFLSYYGDPERVDSPSLIPAIAQPTLVLAAGEDEVVRGLPEKIAPLVNDKVQMKIIEGADHSFRDLYADEAAETIDRFLRAVAHEHI